MDANATTNTDRFDKIDSQFDMFGKQFAKMDDRFAEMDARFDKIDDRFAKIDQRFTKVDQQFDKLTFYMLKRFDNIDRKLEEKADKGDMQIALGLLDTIAKRQETYDEERLVMSHQIGRLDNWTHELADKIGHQLSA